MNRLVAICLLFCCAWSLSAQEEKGIKFFKGTWDEAVELAKKEHKIVFVDAFAVWCGPCKKMARDVFTDEQVGKYFNKHFVNVKFDMEKGEGPKFKQKYKVSVYPTLLFIDGDGEVVNMSKGSKSIDKFIALGKSTLNKYDKSADYEEDYTAGKREPDFLKAYAYALLVSAKPTLKIANEYLKTQKDSLDSDENLDFIFDFANEADSRLFKMLVEHKAALIKLKSEKTYYEKVRNACDATVKKAVEFKMKDLVKEATSQMKAANPSFAKEYALLAEIDYSLGTGDMETIMTLTEKYVKKFAKSDAKKLHAQAQFFLQITQEEKALDKAEQWAKKAYELEKTHAHGTTYLWILDRQGKRREAGIVAAELEKLAPQKLEKTIPKILNGKD